MRNKKLQTQAGETTMHDMRKTMSGKKSGRYQLLVTLIFLLLVGCASMTDKEAAEEVSPETALVPAGQKQITGITFSGADPSGAANRVLLTASSQLEYTSIKQRDPLGIVFYFPETSLGQIQPQYAPTSDIIASVKTAMSPDQKGARVEVVLKKDSAYEVKRTGNDIEIMFAAKAKSSLEEEQIADSKAPSAAKADYAASSVALSGSEFSGKSPTKETKPQSAPKAASFRGSSVIERLDFSSETSGKSSVIVGTTAPADYTLTKLSDRELKLRIFNSRLPEFRQHRPLITTRFASAIDRITPIQAADANATDIIIELRELVPYRPVQDGSVITLSFDASSVEPRKMDSAQLPAWQQALAQTPAPSSMQQTSLPSGENKPFIQSVLEPTEDMPVKVEEQMHPELADKKVYTGQKIALDFYETDIKNVFRILQQVSGKNYAVDKDVTGEVTIALEKPVPWDQVMDLILQMNDLGKKEQGDIIRIAKTSKLKKEEEEMAAKIAAIRAKEAEKKLLEPIEIEFIPVNYATAKSEVLPKIKNMITKGRGSLDVDERNNQLIIQDTRKVIERVKGVISEIDKVTPQVLIEARIVEVRENYERELGIAWGVSGEDIYRSDMNGMYSYNAAINVPAALPAQNMLNFNFTRLDAWGTPIVLDAALRAMEQEGNGKIISSPKILTLDNKEAVIKQGQKVPYTERGEEGTNTTKYAEALLELTVTPHMTPDKRISMKVKTTKDEITGYSPDNQPILSVNQAETVLLVEDGATLVIGGVAKTSETETESGFPVLKDIPLLGWLFKSTDTKSEKQELLIFMTPKIVQLEQKNLVKIE
jgi:type IV pilus assembly protein PilQ